MRDCFSKTRINYKYLFNFKNQEKIPNCSKKCGGGTRFRTRSVRYHARNGGVRCPRNRENRKCNMHSCRMLVKIALFGVFSVKFLTILTFAHEEKLFETCFENIKRANVAVCIVQNSIYFLENFLLWSLALQNSGRNWGIFCSWTVKVRLNQKPVQQPHDVYVFRVLTIFVHEILFSL